MLREILDFIAPRACRMCGRQLSATEEEICMACNWRLPRTKFSAKPYDNMIARLFWGQFDVERAAALMFYQSHSNPSNLIYQMKYHGHPEIGVWFGRIAAEEFKTDGFFEGVDLIVPVPLSRKRRMKRGYNQSEQIARGVSSVTGLPICTSALKRTRFTDSQTKLNSSSRKENVADVFRLVKPEKVERKHILLVDDIVTSGATLTSCGRELAKAGGVRISILTIGFTKS